MFPEIKSAIEQTAQAFDSFKQSSDKRIDSLKSEQASLIERIEGLESKGMRPGKTVQDARSLGDVAFDELQENFSILEKTRSVRLNIKAATDAVTTGSGRNVIVGGVGAPTGRVLGIQYGIPQRSAPSASAVEYSRYTGVQGAAAQQAAEGDAKAAVRPDHTIVTQNALTIAGYAKMSRQALNDRAALARSINITLRRSVDLALDAALVNGATGFTGGFEQLATPATSATYQALVDAISEGVSVQQAAGFAPDVVALNPADWLAITVAKGSDAHYLSGAYLGSMAMELRGLRVVLSSSVDAGKALLIDSAHVELLVVDGFSVEIGYDGSDFTKNLVTMLGELRVVPVFLSVGAMRLITPKP